MWDDVREVVSEEEMRADKKATVTGGRWAVHEGDNEAPNVRAQYVATEANREASMVFDASTPPLEANKLRFAQFAHRQTLRGKKAKLMFIDVTETYCNASPTISIYVKLPKELVLAKGSYVRLLRCGDGARDAGMLWEEAYSEISVQAGFRRGKESPRAFATQSDKSPWFATGKISLL